MRTTQWQNKIPMLITLSRILAVPLIVGALFANTSFWNFFAAAIFILASCTDYFDGFFARRWNLVSVLGKFMDPIADKILVTGTLVMILYKGLIDPLSVILILSRDIFIGGVRSVAAAENLIIDAKPAGKWKTALQMIAIPALILQKEGPLWSTLGQISQVLLWISVLLSITSGIEYSLLYFNAVEKNSTNKK